ncbi:hypothetical protein FLAT13_04969 [Flavobacterium salmonis]|uniref:Uncharacterized protein n=1 Tax=Flavobacterium salmonis TaxID=2654844 RepID=A0A6V6ZCX9_9FLAO|nr:hypothetical protein FLAT13_04969 [Flavobacterium salmonis]
MTISYKTHYQNRMGQDSFISSILKLYDEDLILY